jgi:hypothetical protein
VCVCVCVCVVLGTEPRALSTEPLSYIPNLDHRF